MKWQRLYNALLLLPLLAFGVADTPSPVSWLTFDEAVVASEQGKRKIFIDVYTDWCGWCKRMDATTFSDPAVAEILQNKFYPVKFNAEQREPITFNNHTFNFVHAALRAIMSWQLHYLIIN